MRVFLERIEARNSTLRAYPTVPPDLAMAQAWGAKKDIVDHRPRSPMHGIPFAPQLPDPYCQ
jgi:Asp-tRNA(Asn)/Glu-tRNA(Gln) amidotransferase A subunit family amidase